MTEAKLEEQREARRTHAAGGSRARRVGVWCFILVLILTVPLSAFAWGTKGHRVVAGIAEDLLTPEARREVTNLLDPGTTLADISTWADELRSRRPNTGLC